MLKTQMTIIWKTRAGQGMGKGHAASVPARCPSTSRRLPAWKLPTSYLGDLMEASSHRHDPLLTPLQPLHPSWTTGGKAKAPSCWPWLGVPADQSPPRSPTRATSLETKTSYDPGNSKRFRALCQALGDRPLSIYLHYLVFYYLILHAGPLPGFQTQPSPLKSSCPSEHRYQSPVNTSTAIWALNTRGFMQAWGIKSCSLQCVFQNKSASPHAGGWKE